MHASIHVFLPVCLPSACPPVSGMLHTVGYVVEKKLPVCFLVFTIMKQGNKQFNILQHLATAKSIRSKAVSALRVSSNASM
jgi:hypothetical protein